MDDLGSRVAAIQDLMTYDLCEFDRKNLIMLYASPQELEDDDIKDFCERSLSRPYASKLKDVTIIDLSGQSRITGTSLLYIARCKSLRSVSKIDLRHTQIEGHSLFVGIEGIVNSEYVGSHKHEQNVFSDHPTSEVSIILDPSGYERLSLFVKDYDKDQSIRFYNYDFLITSKKGHKKGKTNKGVKCVQILDD